MLYTFAKYNYQQENLIKILMTTTDKDAIVLWQDGVLLLLEYYQLFKQSIATVYVLEQDILARNLSLQIQQLGQNKNFQLINLEQLIQLTVDYTPQYTL